MDINLMGFDVSAARQKPETIRHKEESCPFCDREHQKINHEEKVH